MTQVSTRRPSGSLKLIKNDPSVSIATTVWPRAEVNPSPKVRNASWTRTSSLRPPYVTSASLLQPGVHDNRLPDEAPPATVDQLDLVRTSNEIPLLRGNHGDQQLSDVLMSQAGNNSVLSESPGVLAGGWSSALLTPPLLS